MIIKKLLRLQKPRIDETVYYALITGEYSFYIYPDKYVHNMDFAVMPTASTVVIGLLEVVNPVVPKR